MREDISLIKFFVAGILQKVLDRAIQVHGALGLTDATLLSYWYRHERGARIYDGPDEVHKIVVAPEHFAEVWSQLINPRQSAQVRSCLSKRYSRILSNICPISKAR